MGTMHELSVMDSTGDTKTIWDADNATEVANARRTFDDFKKKGFAIYRVEGDGDRGEIMHKFDPEAEKMIAVPRMAGG